MFLGRRIANALFSLLGDIRFLNPPGWHFCFCFLFCRFCFDLFLFCFYSLLLLDLEIWPLNGPPGGQKRNRDVKSVSTDPPGAATELLEPSRGRFRTKSAENIDFGLGIRAVRRFWSTGVADQLIESLSS